MWSDMTGMRYANNNEEKTQMKREAQQFVVQSGHQFADQQQTLSPEQQNHSRRELSAAGWIPTALHSWRACIQT